MSSGIFLIKDDGTLVNMKEESYESEDSFQVLLAEYPDLLAGDQINSAEPRKWLLITREAGIPDEEDGSARWSLDHLFVDQDGIPTLVEVKRSSDTRLRREVVAQMLDYAANAVVYWPVEKLRAIFETQCEKDDQSPAIIIERCFDGAVNEDELWTRVKTNLQAGQIRMIFVADVIPPELRRIVEFLNGQMDPAEVLAVELRHYSGEGQKIIVPRLHGLTAEAEKKRVASARRLEPWTIDSFMEQIEQGNHPEEIEIATKIIDWARELGLEISGGYGPVYSSLAFGISSMRILRMIYSERGSYIELSFVKIADKTPNILSNFCEILNKIHGVDLSPDQKYPNIRINLLKKTDAWETFTQAISVLFEGLEDITE